MQTVVELDSFLRAAKPLMSDEERADLVNFVAANPQAGVSLGGGLHKLRVARPGSGKSGSYRTVYVFGGRSMPVFLITVFAKNEKANLSRSEQAALIEAGKRLLEAYGVPR